MIDELTEIPSEIYHDQSKITLQKLYDFTLRLPHKSLQMAMTTSFSDLAPDLCELFRRAPEAGRKRRLVQIEAMQDAKRSAVEAVRSADAAAVARALRPPAPAGAEAAAGTSLGSTARGGAAAAASSPSTGSAGAGLGGFLPSLWPDAAGDGAAVAFPEPFHGGGAAAALPEPFHGSLPSPARWSPGLRATPPQMPAAVPPTAGAGAAERPSPLGAPGGATPLPLAPPSPAVKEEPSDVEMASAGGTTVAELQGREIHERLDVAAPGQQASFFELCDQPPCGAHAAARRFANLMAMSMEGIVELFQDDAYGDIGIARGPRFSPSSTAAVATGR